MNIQTIKKLLLCMCVFISSYVSIQASMVVDKQEQQKAGWSNKQVACVVVPLAVTAAGLGLYAASLRGHLNQVGLNMAKIIGSINPGQGEWAVDNLSELGRDNALTKEVSITCRIFVDRIRDTLLRVQGHDGYRYNRILSVGTNIIYGDPITALEEGIVSPVRRFIAGLGGLAVVQRLAPGRYHHWFDIIRATQLVGDIDGAAQSVE